MTANDHRDVYLTIVPADMDEGVLDTIVDGTEEMPRLPVAKAAKKPKAVPVFAPAATPTPAPSRVPVAVAGLMGGMVIGGAGVAALLALMVGTAALAGGATWWLASSSAVALEEVAPVEAPVEPLVDDAAPVGDDEAPVDEAPAAAPAPVRDAPRSEAPAAAPAAPVAAPAAPAKAPVEAPEELPATMSVKLLSDPPAATVFVDGVNVGRTPLKADLPTGTHTVTIESGKATGTFSIDTGSASRFCFAAAGRKVTQSSCN